MSLESKLDDNYNILRLGVISSNSISSRTTLLVKHLSQKSSDGKHAIASMHAKSPVANKLISIVEIAKRDISEAGQKVFQYSAISFESISVKRTVKDKASRPENAGHGDSMADEEDVAFEVMGKTEKRRDIPVLTIYLSLSPIKELRDAYGWVVVSRQAMLFRC